MKSPSGALAGRFTDVAVEDELPPTDDVFFLADLQGNASVDPFTFGVTQDITWPPSLPRNASTQFTLSVVDSEDGSFLYNIFVTGGPAACWGAEPVDPLGCTALQCAEGSLPLSEGSLPLSCPTPTLCLLLQTT